MVVTICLSGMENEGLGVDGRKVFVKMLEREVEEDEEVEERDLCLSLCLGLCLVTTCFKGSMLN